MTHRLFSQGVSNCRFLSDRFSPSGDQLKGTLFVLRPERKKTPGEGMQIQAEFPSIEQPGWVTEFKDAAGEAGLGPSEAAMYWPSVILPRTSLGSKKREWPPSGACLSSGNARRRPCVLIVGPAKSSDSKP